MFNDLVVAFFVVLSWGVLIVGALLALYILISAVRQLFARRAREGSRLESAASAAGPEKRSPGSREAETRR